MRRDFSVDRIGSSEFHVAFRYGDAKQAQRIERELINKVNGRGKVAETPIEPESPPHRG
jgi:hypothetical protein